MSQQENYFEKLKSFSTKLDTKEIEKNLTPLNKQLSTESVASTSYSTTSGGIITPDPSPSLKSQEKRLSFVPSMACILNHLVKIGGKLSCGDTRFQAVSIPHIPISSYLNRIEKFFSCSNECFVLALVYLDRIVKSENGITVNRLNIHRLLLIAMMLSVKFFEDTYYSNAYYSKIGGIRLSETNLLEAEFIKMIDWNLNVTPEEFEQYKNNVVLAVTSEPL